MLSFPLSPCHFFSFFFFNDTATTEIYTLSLHDALPICGWKPRSIFQTRATTSSNRMQWPVRSTPSNSASMQIGRHTSELQSHVNLVCRLLLEKKKKKTIT